MDYLTGFLTTAGIVFGFFVKGKWKETNWAGKTIMIVLLFAAFSGAYYNHKQANKNELIEKVTAKIGEFKDLVGATIPKLCSGKGQGIGIPINQNGMFIRPGAKPLFRIYVIDGKLFVDAVVRDKDKNVIAVIDGNVWTMFRDDYEYNNDETGFEIVTRGDRQVYFQVYLENGIAHILGIITDKDGYGVKFRDAPLPARFQGTKKRIEYVEYVAVGPTEDKEKFKEAYEPLDGAIFKYPRGKYLGQRK